MLHIDYTTQFKKDLKLARRRQKSLKKIQDIMEKIAAEEPLEKNCLIIRSPVSGVAFVNCTSSQIGC